MGKVRILAIVLLSLTLFNVVVAINKQQTLCVNIDGLPKGVKKGDKVAPGMIVGYVGKSGYSDRFSETMYPQHLHLGVLECSTFKQDKIIIKNNSIYEWIGDMIFADGRIKYVNPFNHAEYGCVRIKL